MIFWILTPVPPCTWVPPFWGGDGEGSKLLSVLWPLCVYLDLGPKEFFFLYMDPLTHGGGPGSPPAETVCYSLHFLKLNSN